MNKKIIYSLFFIVSLILPVSSPVYAASVSITGAVKQPINLSIEDLCRFKTVRIQLNEILKDKSYRGAWFYTGVPLRALLETAFVEKEESAFKKPIDLAVLVKNSKGEEVALSWGEIFFKNSYDIIVATSATPIKPRHSCSSCHKPAEYEPRMKQFDRKIGFPKLVVACDGYADRSIENIVSIEVIDPSPGMPADRSVELYSPSFVVTGNVKHELTIKDFSGFPHRKEMHVLHMGEGKGYHGSDDYSGVLFNDIIKKAGIEPSFSQIFYISAPDGYRTTFSYGEIFLNRVEDNTIIADMKNGKKIKKEGKFIFVPSDDLMADRDIKAVNKIEVIDLKRKPELTFIGIGCGDTDLLTLKAITAMSRADEFICNPDMKKRFGKYMGNKPILFDIYDFIPPVVKKQNPGLSRAALNKILEGKRTEMADTIKAELKEGKNVAILDYGDPTIWSASEYLSEHFNADMIDIVPGLSSFNVASAMLKRHTGCKGSIILTTSKGMLGNKPLFEAAAKNGETLSVFMAMKDLPDLVEFLNKAYKEDIPVHIVYCAGYSGSEKVVITDIKGLKNTIDSEKEKNLFLVFIGPCLNSSAKAQRH